MYHNMYNDGTSPCQFVLAAPGAIFFFLLCFVLDTNYSLAKLQKEVVLL